MAEQESMDKAQLLEKMRGGYAALEAQLAPLSEQQLTATTKTEGEWSIKDHLTHLTAWQRRVIQMLQAVKDGVEIPDPTPDLTEEQINEQFYQEGRSLPLRQVQAEFRTTYQGIVEAVEGMTDEQLNRPVSWLNERPIWPWIVGNTYGHYEEHMLWMQEELTKVEHRAE